MTWCALGWPLLPLQEPFPVVEGVVWVGTTWFVAEGCNWVGPALGTATVASEPFAVAVNTALEVGDGGGSVVVGGRVARRRLLRRKLSLLTDSGAAAVGFDDGNACVSR